MIILGIETSCDETALALIETRKMGGVFGCRVIDSLVHSQAELHSAYGGVYPNLAKREHKKNLPILFNKLFGEVMERMPVSSKIKSDEKGWSPATNSLSLDALKVDTIAVTEGPGLEPALWVGIEFARELGEKWKVPVIPVNHMEGHIVGSLLESDAPRGAWQRLKELELPAIALLISGGHTELVNISGAGGSTSGGLTSGGEASESGWLYQILGQTLDDACGEAFDKTARLLGLPYPGGPHISRLATQAEEEGVKPSVKLPRPMIGSNDFNFSFSGLKTAVLYAVRKAQEENAFTETYKKGLALEFELAVTEVLEKKTREAIEEVGAHALIIGGGVSANRRIRERFEKLAEKSGVSLFLPSRHISGDNALMIALAGALRGAPAERNILRAQGTKRL